jgi:hypothetical protein
MVKGERNSGLTPDLGALPKTKKRPRGRPFPKGDNPVGLSTRFRKGESGNPHGRPKSAEISKALRKLLAAEVSLPRKGRTYAEKLVTKWVEKGLGGNTAAIAAIADRAEGRPNISISTDGSGDNLTLILAAMSERHAQIGPPENFISIEAGEAGE